MLCFCAALTAVSLPAASEITINEILTATDETDGTGTPLEWIELYNSGIEAVSLRGYALSDDADRLDKWAFPTVSIGAQSRLLVWATGHNRLNPNGLHANFQLRREGETLFLSDPSGVVLDRLAYPPQRRNISYGRRPDGASEWRYFDSPSPGLPNRSAGYEGFAAPPLATKSAGVYADPLSVELLATETGATIRFTLDGSEPHGNSPSAEGTIAVTESLNLRARVFREGYLPSATVTHSYLIGVPLDIPVMVLSTDPSNLWGRNGIHTNATRHGRDWERPVSMELFRPDGRRWLQVDAGLRIHGGASRERSDKKSFRLYFRDEYGPRLLRARVIPSAPADEFDRLVLRAGYNDSWVHWDQQERDAAIYVSDQLGRNIHMDMGAAGSHGTYVELYLNGQYWGLYNLCERYDEFFMQTYFGGGAWDVISDGEVKEGTSGEWNRLRNFVLRNDFSEPDTLGEIGRLIDLEQVTDYYLLNIHVQNHDWPHHNWYAARERTPAGRWRFFTWDIEDSFGSGASRGKFNLNTFAKAKDGSLLGDLFGQLVQNPEYQEYLLERLEHHLDNALSRDHLSRRLNGQLDIVRPVMNREAERWNPNKGLEAFERAADIARLFIRRREEFFRKYTYNGLGRSVPAPVLEWRLFE